MIKLLRLVHISRFIFMIQKHFKIACFKLIAFVLTTMLSNIALANIQTIEVVKNNSKTVAVPEKIKTMIIGNPVIAKVVVLNPDTLLINATSFGNTSLSLIGKSGNSYEYKIHVTHDLGILREHLKKIDSRIIASSDLNGDAIILTGVAKDQAQSYKAEEAALRYFGTYQSTLTLGGRNNTNAKAVDPTGKALPNENDPQPRYDNEYLRNGRITSGVKIVNLIATEEMLKSSAERLQALLIQIDERIQVEEVNNVMMLKGKVKTPAALTRVLSTADRFVAGGNIPPDFSVISDQGGVLTGNTDEEEVFNPVLPQLTVGQGNNGNGRNGGGNNGGGNNGGVGGGGAGNGNNNGRVRNGNGGGGVRLSPNKGNLAQNISRGDVIMSANGRVMSTIKVDKNPRVEIQMRIVGVDRSKTEDLGLDWSLVSTSVNGNKSTAISLGSFLGDVNNNPFGVSNGNNTTVDAGTSSLVLGIDKITGNKTLSLLGFLRWVETKGAAKTLTEPLLTALSGESATFSVGGTLPVLTQDQTNTGGLVNTNITSQTITFLQYGLGIVVRPTVLENGKISIILDQTLSEPDFNVAVPVLSAEVPGFKTRTVNTITESADGETWAVAGLLNEDDTVTTKSVPYLSNIPVLGWLFRNENKGKSRRELLIVVTARLIGDQSEQTSDKPSTSSVIDKINAIQDAPLKPAPTMPKQPTSSAGAQTILQKETVYSKTAKPKVTTPTELIP